MIENTKFIFFFCWVSVYIYNLSNKKVCIYVCVYIYVYEDCLDKYISVATWLPQIKIPSSAPAKDDMIKIYQNAKRRHKRGIIK